MVDVDHVDAVEQVFAEPALSPQPLAQVHVGGEHDTHVHLDGLVVADALETALLQDASAA